MAKLKLMAAGLCLALFAGLGSIARGQTQSKPSGPSGAATAQANQNAATAQSESADLAARRLDLKEGTKISADLASTVDASMAKPGDQVVARVTKNVKDHGQTVIRKGDELVGRVTQVQAAGSGNAGSSVGIAFDRVVEGNSSSQLTAVLNSVVSTPSERRAEQQQMAEEPISGPVVTGGGSAAGGGRASGGGLVGGVGSAAGSVAGAASSTVGATANSAGSTINSTTAGATSATGNLAGNAVGAVNATGGARSGGGALIPTPRNAIRLSTEGQGQASQQAGTSSLLSTRKGNLRLEQGTELQFRAAASADSTTK